MMKVYYAQTSKLASWLIDFYVYGLNFGDGLDRQLFLYTAVFDILLEHVPVVIKQIWSVSESAYEIYNTEINEYAEKFSQHLTPLQWHCSCLWMMEHRPHCNSATPNSKMWSRLYTPFLHSSNFKSLLNSRHVLSHELCCLSFLCWKSLCSILPLFAWTASPFTFLAEEIQDYSSALRAWNVQHGGEISIKNNLYQKYLALTDNEKLIGGKSCYFCLLQCCKPLLAVCLCCSWESQGRHTWDSHVQ